MATETYRGSCQCGAVAYEADADLGGTVVTCNCSRCERLGTTLTFVAPDAFRLETGEGAMTEYRFASETIQHLFCSICGVESFARGKMPDGTPMIAVNVNCLEGVDPRALKTTHYDGASV